MEYKISDYVTIWEKYDPLELHPLSMREYFQNASADLIAARSFGNPTRIWIKDKWYDVISIHRVVRSTSTVDGSYHFLYIQINMDTNEYYIGKVNRKRWSELKRYQGSGLRFKSKYKGHENCFVRYYFLCCSTAKETEAEEAKIVDDVLLADPKCLNLVKGGGGTYEHYDREKRAAFQRQYMKEHPENYQAMVEKAKEINNTADSALLKKRVESIKATMSDDYYRQMTSERIRRWKLEHPDEYQKSRENNRLAQQTPESREKRRQSREKWVLEHPDEYEAQKEKLAMLRQSPEAKKKRTESIKAWNAAHPDEAKANAKKRSAASVEKTSKRVNMCDLETGEIIRTFKSQHEAAQWLVDNGLAKNKNCVSAINAVCQKKPCTTGYGYHKKAYGFDWQYAD